MYFAVELCILLRNYMYAAAELNFHIVEGGGEWLTLNWYMTLKGTYFYPDAQLRGQVVVHQNP